MTSPEPTTNDPAPPSPLRCGAVGVGRMGRHHARVYAELDGCELVGVVDRDPERAQEVAERHGSTAFESEAALLEAGLDAVSIAVPTTAHLHAAEPFLRAGVGCLIEKPLAESADVAERITAAARDGDATLMVGHIERFNPIMRAMHAATRGGADIRPRFIEVSRVSPMTFRSVDVSVVMDMMIHDLDMVLMLMGGEEPDEVSASGVAVVTPFEDICNARLLWRRPDGNCVANVTSSRLALKTERVMRITGESAYAKIDFGAKTGTLIRRLANEAQRREVYDQLRDGADLTDLKWDELINIEPLEIDEGEPIAEEIKAFVHAVRTGSRPAIDGSAGAAAVRTAQRIVEASKEFT